MVRRQTLMFFKYVIILFIHFISEVARSMVGFVAGKKEESNFVWKRRKGRTWTSGTGPEYDHTTGNGYYVYIDANGGKKGDVARLTSQMQEPGTKCLTFWYSMYGRNIGALNVYVKTNDGNETVVFSKMGNLGSSDWQKEDISQQPSAMYKVVIEGIRGDGNKGDIAVDDVSVTDELCSVDCNFDTGLCQWIQDDDDDFDWTWKTGSADINNETGPPGDHTSGKHVRELRILKEEEAMTVEIIKITREHGQEWIQENAFLNSTIRFRIMIEGRVRDRNPHDLGDIAIDDLLMLSCQDCSDPTPRNGNANSSNFQYSSAVEITCNLGYYIAGKPTIVCQSGGTWSDNVSCEPVECSDPEPEYGRLNSTNFLYSSKVEITCNAGYNIRGDSIIRCQADGAWTGSPTCTLLDSENSALIAVYILVPIVVLAVLLSVFVILWRKGTIRCLLAPNTNRKQDTKDQPRSGPLFTNVTYSENHSKTHSNADGALSQDTEYAVITDVISDDLQAEHSPYCNISDAEITKQENITHSYDHTKVSAAPIFDNTYSHISGDNLGKVSLQTDSKSVNNCSYEVLNIHKSNKSSGKTQQSNMQDVEGSEYDHATAGGIDPVDLDDYSHLNDRTVASELSKYPKAEYEQAVGETPHYFVLEAEKNDTLAGDTHYFVLEKEETVDC